MLFNILKYRGGFFFEGFDRLFQLFDLLIQFGFDVLDGLEAIRPSLFEFLSDWVDICDLFTAGKRNQMLDNSQLGLPVVQIVQLRKQTI